MHDPLPHSLLLNHLSHQSCPAKHLTVTGTWELDASSSRPSTITRVKQSYSCYFEFLTLICLSTSQEFDFCSTVIVVVNSIITILVTAKMAYNRSVNNSVCSAQLKGVTCRTGQTDTKWGRDLLSNQAQWLSEKVASTFFSSLFFFLSLRYLSNALPHTHSPLLPLNLDFS